MLRLITLYQRWVSPWLPPHCRYYPTCSEYAIDAIRLHGRAKGSALAFKRICRCHPWSASGYDPVPECGAADACSADTKRTQTAKSPAENLN